MGPMSRRSFLKLTGATAVAVAGTAMLSGCSINTVTVIAMQNDIEISRAKFPLPSSMSLDWAIQLMKPVYLTNIRLTYPELGDELNNITFEADPSYPNNGQQVQDENGNWTMVIAVKTNYASCTLAIRSTSVGISQFISPVPVMDSWTKLPDAMMNKYVQEFAAAYPKYTVTLADRADNGLVIREAGKKPSVTLYVDTVEKD